MQNKNRRWLIFTILLLATAAVTSLLWLNRAKINSSDNALNKNSTLLHQAFEPIANEDSLSKCFGPNFTEKQSDLIEFKKPQICVHDAQTEIIKNTNIAEKASQKRVDEPYHIFFDIRHVLLHTSGTAAAKAVGVSNMFWYTVKHKKTPNHLEIQARLFEFMDYCTKLPRGAALFNNEPMPALMCEWASGKITAKHFLDTVLSYKKEIKEFFISEEEKNLVLGTLKVFKPNVICNIQRPIHKMITFFQECCKDFPEQIFILSNWDRESAHLIIKEFPQIFDKLNRDHIIFSGDIGKLKPEVDIFNYVTKEMNLDPAKCVLIDDIAENIRAAKELGWRTILHKNTDRTIHKIKKILCIETNLSKSKKKKK